MVVKDIKSMLLFRPRLLKKFKVSNGKLFKNKKTYFNITAIFNTYTPIIKIKGVRFYAEGLAIRLQILFIRFLVFKGGVSKVI